MDIFSGRMAKFYYILFNLIAITIILYISVDAFYRVLRMKYTQLDLQTVTQPVILEETPSVSVDLDEYQVIIDRNIFSKNNLPAQKTDIDVDALNRTSLKLVLLGTITGNEKNSAAFIQDTRTRTSDLYREGDSVQGSTIKSILNKKVVLSTGNKDEILEMEETVETGKTSDIVQVETASETLPEATALVERNINIQRSYIDESLQDLNGLLSQASIQPHSTDGVPDGLTITGIKAGSIFRRMGLRNGDLIIGVNNEAIKTTEDIINMYNDLKSAPDISLQISRRGQERSFNYTFIE